MGGRNADFWSRHEGRGTRWTMVAAALALSAAACTGPGSIATSTSTDSGATATSTTTVPETSTTAGLGAPSTEYPSDPFVPSDQAGVVPDLANTVAYANLGDAEIFTLWGDAMQAGAEARGLEYLTANAGFDPATNVEQVGNFLNVGVGAVLMVVLDAAAQRQAVLDGIEQGAAMFTVAFGPSTTQIVTDQYATGETAANAMVDYINGNLGGEAQILMFNLDDREAIRPRYEAVREVVAAAGPGIEIAVDQLGNPQTQEFGFEVMNTVLQSNPEVNVVIGEDAHVLGALAALEAAGVDHDDRWLLVGIGGETQALETLAGGDTPLKIDVSFALAPLGLIPSVYAEEWLAGRAIPKVIEANPVLLETAEEVEGFLEDMSDPEALLGGPKMEEYFTLLGNISYENRMSYYDGDGVPID